MFDIKQAEQLIATFNQLAASLPAADEGLTKEKNDDTLPLLDIEAPKQLLEKFKSLPTPPERRKAFLEIIGLSHLESISSKALAFFLDTNEAHDLNDLVLQALLSCLNQNSSDINIYGVIHTEAVEKEVSTNQGSRIDLLIETANELIIIENKIHHNANNPFDDYYHYGEQRRADKKGYYIVLGLDKPKEAIPDTFCFINHADLGDAIRQRLGNYIAEANQYYVNALIDYLQAIDAINPNTRIGQMEQAIVDFFGNNHKQIQELYDAREHFIDYAEQQLLVVNESLEKNNSMVFNLNRVDVYPEYVGKCLASDNISSHHTAIDTDIVYYFYIGIYSSGVYLNIERLKNLSGGRAHKDTLIRLKNILDVLDVEYDDMEDYANDAEFVIIKKLNWDASPDDIVKEVQPILQKIAKKLNLSKEV